MIKKTNCKAKMKLPTRITFENIQLVKMGTIYIITPEIRNEETLQ